MRQHQDAVEPHGRAQRVGQRAQYWNVALVPTHLYIDGPRFKIPVWQLFFDALAYPARQGQNAEVNHNLALLQYSSNSHYSLCAVC